MGDRRKGEKSKGHERKSALTFLEEPFSIRSKVFGTNFISSYSTFVKFDHANRTLRVSF